MKNENNNQLYNLHLKRTRERINKEQNLFMEVLKDNLINKPQEVQTKEEKDENKKRLLNFVHRYVFLQRLQPLDSNVDKINRVVVESYRIKKFVKYYLFIRNFIGNFFKLRALLIILSAIFFFFFRIFQSLFFIIFIK